VPDFGCAIREEDKGFTLNGTTFVLLLGYPHRYRPVSLDKFAWHAAVTQRLQSTRHAKIWVNPRLWKDLLLAKITISNGFIRLVCQN
jgi:hypothetical protein